MKVPANKKGNTDFGAGMIITIGVSVITIAVIAIMLGAFRIDLVTNTPGCNSTDTSKCGYDYNVSTRGLTFLDNATSKFSTAGTIVGVLLLLGIIGGGAFLGVQGYRKLKG